MYAKISGIFDGLHDDLKFFILYSSFLPEVIKATETSKRCLIKRRPRSSEVSLSPIITHPVQGGGLHRNLLFDGPDPFFPPQYKRKKKGSGYARLTVQ